MNEIIHKCRFLEDNLSINTAADYVFSNIGFLISTDLSLITELCKYDFNRDKIYATKMKDIMISKKTTSKNTNIIITNNYLINLWQKEDVCVIKNKEIDIKDMTDKNVVIMSIDTAIRNADLLATIGFKRVILDNITNPKLEKKLSKIEYDFKWYVISAKQSIKHKYDFIEHITINALDDNRKIDTIYIESRKPLVSLTLEGLVDEVMINDIDTYNINYIIRHLTDSTIKTEKNIIKCVMRKFQEQTKTIDTHEYCINNMYFANEKDKIDKLDKLIKKRNEIHNKEKELIKRITENELCFVCYNEIEVKSILRCCSNKICFQCLQKWMTENNSCPLCKKTPLDYYIVETDIVEQTKDEDNEKMTKFKSIFDNFTILTREILSHHNRKILLLGKSQQFLKRFVCVLRDMGITHVYLEGNSNRIYRQMMDFNHDRLRVVVISTTRIHSGIPIDDITDIISISRDDCIHAFNTHCRNVKNNYVMVYA